MSLSLIVLTGLILLLMFGLGQRILDQMRLNDKQAIIILLAIIIGIIIPPIYVTEYFALSIGGFLIPFAICIYMLCSAGWSRDLLRAFIGTILVAGIIYGLEWLMPAETPEDIVIDPMYVYGIVAGIVAYALGRSRRNAFVCSVLGVSLAMLVQFIINMAMGTPTVLGLGVGGAFGTQIISIIIAVALCEFLGRAFESAKKDDEKKEFNFVTHTYDSQKNGKLNADGTKNVSEDEIEKVLNVKDEQSSHNELRGKLEQEKEQKTSTMSDNIPSDESALKVRKNGNSGTKNKAKQTPSGKNKSKKNKAKRVNKTNQVKGAK